MDKGQPFEGYGSAALVLTKTAEGWLVAADIMGQDPGCLPLARSRLAILPVNELRVLVGALNAGNPANPLHNAAGTARMRGGRKGDGYGEVHFRHEPVVGRLRRPYGVCPKPQDLSSLHRAGCAAWPGAFTVARMYEVMRYWDDDKPDWGAEERDFAAAWRANPNGSYRGR